MPNLEHFLDDLEEIGIEPKQFRIPGQLYDNMLAEAEDIITQKPDEDDE